MSSEYVNKRAVFNGYESLADTEEAILEEGCLLTIEAYKGDDGFVVADDDGNRDTLYMSEFTIDDTLSPKAKKTKKKAVKKTDDTPKESKTTIKVEAKKPKKEVKKQATTEEEVTTPTQEEKPTKEVKSLKKSPSGKKKGLPNKNKFTEQEVDTNDLVPVADLLPKNFLDLEDVEGEPSALVAKLSSVDKVEEEEAEQVVTIMQTLGSRAEELYFHIGGLLKFIKDRHIHFTLGFEDTSEGFSNFVDLSGVCSRHMAKKWIYIYERAKHFSLNMTDLRGIGWAKARLILAHANEGNINKLLKKARTLSYSDLNAFLNGVAIEDDEDNDTKAKQINSEAVKDFFKFMLPEDKAQTIKSILEMHSDTLANGNDSEVFYMAMIALDEAQGGTNASLEDHINFIEKNYNVKLEVKDADNDDIIENEVEEVKKPKAKRTGKKVDITKKATKEDVLLTAEENKIAKKKSETSQDDGLDVLFE